MEFERITVDPGRMNGQPCVRHMRLTVRRVVELTAFYQDREQLRQEYPELEDEDIRQALLYAAAYLDDRVLDSRSAMKLLLDQGLPRSARTCLTRVHPCESVSLRPFSVVSSRFPVVGGESAEIGVICG